MYLLVLSITGDERFVKQRRGPWNIRRQARVFKDRQHTTSMVYYNPGQCERAGFALQEKRYDSPDRQKR